jgi:hypothetical protein
MRIYDRDGAERGHVGGRRSLLSDDPALQSLWDAGDGEDDATWRKRIETALVDAGYRVEWYD